MRPVFGYSHPSVHEFGPFRLDAAERLLLRAGQSVSLTPKAFDLLAFLVERHGRLVTKQELMSALWPDTFVEEANLTYTVSALRKALGDGQDGEQYIQTVPTRGYRFVAPVTHEEELPASQSVAGTPPRFRQNLGLQIGVVALTAAAIAMLPFVVRHLRETPDTRMPVRLTIPVPDSPVGTNSVAMAQISPDGSRVAFIVGAVGGVAPSGIRMRGMDASQEDLVRGTEEAQTLFWAPDSQRLAFATASALKTLTISDGSIETLCDACKPARGGTWSRTGSIVFVSTDGELLGIAASGGPPKAVTTLRRAEGEVAHVSPHFLPDGDHFLYSVRYADAGRSGLFVGQAGSAERKLVLQGEHAALYAAPGYLLFNREGSIVAQPFDLRRLELSGQPLPLVGPSEYWPSPAQGGDIIAADWFGGRPNFSASDTGRLTYAIAEHPESQFQWFGRGGEPLQLVGEPGAYMTFAVSRDDTRLVYARIAAESSSLWVHDLLRGVTSRLTFGAASSYYDPRWGPDGRWVAANRRTPPPLAIVKIQPDGGESVVSAPAPCVLDDVSSDGRYLLCRGWARDIVATSLVDSAKPVVVRKSPAGFVDQPRFSPDGHWIAFNADESGQHEVYVTRFPPTGERWMVSHGGGVQPVWRRDGRELYYLGLDGILYAVEFPAGDRPQFSVPKRLFNTGLVAPSPWVEQYAVSADGRRVLILKPVSARVRNSIGVILDWPALLHTQR
jgi:eukaryotic-like serine/threonine-protein kinase